MIRIGIAAAACFIVSSGVASAGEWPRRPVTMVVPFSAGGPGDVFGRVLASRLGEVLGQTIVVENYGAGGGMAGAARVAKAAPDGYQFVYANVGTHAQSQTLYKHRLYDAVTDFAPVALITNSAMVLTIRKDLPVRDLSEFIAYAKANQNKMQFASGGAASPGHLACELLNAAIGVHITHVPYRSGGQAMQDMIAGHIDYQCTGAGVSKASIESGQVKPIAILSRERWPLMPKVPSAGEQGVNLEAGSWTAFFLPKGTPDVIVRKLNAATIAAMETPSVRERLGDVGAVVVPPAQRSPEYLQAFVKQEIERWAAMIRASGISVQ